MMTTEPIGWTEPYVAVNHHTMRAPVFAKRDGEGKFAIFARAACTEDCAACHDGAIRPNW